MKTGESQNVIDGETVFANFMVLLCTQNFKTPNYCDSDVFTTDTTNKMYLTHISRMDFPIIINWVSPLSFLGALGVFFF